MLDTATRKEMLQKMVIVRALREDRGALPKKRDVWQHPLVSGSGRRLCRGCPVRRYAGTYVTGIMMCF